MDLSESALTILRLVRHVMWRERLKTLQGLLAMAMLAGGLTASALVLYSRLRFLTIPSWAIALAVILLAFSVATFICLKRRATERDAAFLIDDRLGLEDRITTSQSILDRGGPQNDFEIALIEDAASRIDAKNVSAISPYRVAPWQAVALVGIAALTVSLAIPERSLPGGEELAAARADIQNAGEILEQTATEIESNIAPESETANLAKEQAELGRALRISPETREEALKKLSALEQRIRRRYDELASTRADEIVSIAEQRIRAALSPRPANRSSEAAEGDRLTEETAAPNDSETRAVGKKTRPTPRRANSTETANNSSRSAQPDSKQSDPTESNQSEAARSRAQAGNTNPQNRLQEPVSGQARSNSNNAQAGNAQNIQRENASQQGSQAPGQDAPNQQQQAQGQRPGNQQPETEQQPPGALTGIVAEQAAKAVPAMSEELLKKAQELRAGQMSAEDIRRMAQMAEFLARDLSKLAESKELRAAVEELARQVSPEQIEQVARELMRNEQLRRELEASARMLMQNQQVREMVAGLARQFGPRGQQARDGQSQNQPGEGSQSNQSGSGPRGDRGQGAAPESDRVTGTNKLAEKGKEVRARGNLQRKDGGEYLYLQTKAEAGAARAPYSSAYPQYRREAERSIQRSQVPPHMRSVVRKYFDAINPDAKKQP